MYWSAAFWTIGRTVVEPLILIVCFCPVETGAAVVTAGAGVETAAGAATVETDVGAAVCAGVATGVLVGLSVQPAKSIAKMSNAARLTVISRCELRFPFIVFDHEIYPGY
jgi:hypothetical protein